MRLFLHEALQGENEVIKTDTPSAGPLPTAPRTFPIHTPLPAFAIPFKPAAASTRTTTVIQARQTKEMRNAVRRLYSVKKTMPPGRKRKDIIPAESLCRSIEKQNCAEGTTSVKRVSRTKYLGL